MRSSLVGTLVFTALYVGACSLLFNWELGRSWRLYFLTALLHFAVSEVVRRTKPGHTQRSG